jgi:thymidylate synthase
MRERGASDTDLDFIPLHFGNKLRVVNPRGRVGVITLWSRIDFIEHKLAECSVDLDSDTSRIAVIGNLYGNGLPHLLRNLLYNPQIRDLVICGADRSGSAEELIAFFENGIEETTSLGETVTRIKGTSRIIDALVTPDMFAEKPRIVQFGDLSSKAAVADLCKHLQAFEAKPPHSTGRIQIELPEVKIEHYPSDPRDHSIVRDTPLEAWQELVFRLVRFGHLAHLRKGDRQELQNVRVVVRKPQHDDPAELAKFNFTLDELLQYQSDMLAAELPEDQPYTYGNRIRRYYGFDALEKFAERLRKNPQDRDCYLALWDSHNDIDAEDAPCLVSVFFRVFDEKLTLTANYRTHNALDAWIKNVYGLMKAQEIVAEKAGLEIGPLTVISHSISVDPSSYDLAQRVANAKGFEFDLDPNGQFLFSVDHEAGEIVVQHVSEDGIMLHEYRSDRPQRIQHELARDCAVSDIGHAIYVGRQLTRAEACLKTGETFVEE